MSTAELCDGLLGRYKGDEDSTDNPHSETNGEVAGEQEGDADTASITSEKARKHRCVYELM